MQKSIQLWQEKIGTDPIQVSVDKKPLEKAWENMGVVYGRMQLEKQRYKRAGMTAAIAEIDTKLTKATKELEDKTLDLIGFPRLDPTIKASLDHLARGDNLFLNTYQLAEYQKLPPPNIAQAIMDAKQYFDEIEIWAIEEQKYIRPMKDPAVIGYIKGQYPRVPYLIATWGDDIRPEDLGVL